MVIGNAQSHQQHVASELFGSDMTPSEPATRSERLRDKEHEDDRHLQDQSSQIMAANRTARPPTRRERQASG